VSRKNVFLAGEIKTRNKNDFMKMAGGQNYVSQVEKLKDEIGSLRHANSNYYERQNKRMCHTN
jgi:phage host-nuclease inhibitor protein Gam